MSCEERTARFNDTWFYPELRPKTWQLELATYILCLIGLFVSITVRLAASRLRDYSWLKVRSNSMMIMCHSGALIQLHTGSYSKITTSQTQCWFQIIGSLLVVPLCLIPIIVKLIWFKSQEIFHEAARSGVQDIVKGDSLDEVEFNKLRDAFMKGKMTVRSSQIFSSTMSESDHKRLMIMLKLKRWKFITSRLGTFIVFLVIFSPFLFTTLITFAVTDSIFFSQCTGCVLQFIHTMCIIVFGAVSIVSILVLSFKVKKAGDPFGHIAEVNNAILFGALPALIGFILNFAATAEKWCDGWSWNIVVAVGLLIFSVVQGGYQVVLARRRARAEDNEKNKEARNNRPSRVGTVFNLHSLLQAIMTNKALHDAFEEYLCSEFAVETLAFLDAVTTFRNSYYDRGGASATALAKRILRIFVSLNSTLTINVSAEQRSALINKINGLKENDHVGFDVFDECYAEVSKMVEQGPLVRFVATSKFEELLKSSEAETALAIVPTEGSPSQKNAM